MKLPKAAIWLLFVLFQGPISSQTLFETYSNRQQEVAKEARKPWVDSLLTKAENGNQFEDAINIAYSESRYYNNKVDNLKLAVAYGIRAIDWYEEHDLIGSERVEDYNKVVYNIARFHYWDAQWIGAKAYFQKLIDADLSALYVARAYCLIGDIELELNDPYAAAEYYEKGTQTYWDDDRKRGWVSQSLDLAQIYEEINSTESLQKKLELLTKIDNTVNSGTPISERNASILNLHFGSYYNNDNVFDFERSKFYYLQAVKGTLAQKDTSLVLISYANLANLYAQKRSDSTLIYIDKAKELMSGASTVTRILNIECDYYLALDQLDDALITIHQSLTANTNSSFKIEEAPNKQQINTAVDPKVLLWGLTKKAEIFTRQYRSTGERQFLKKALAQLNAADYVADQLFIGNKEESTKLFWRRYASAIYGNGTFVAWELELPELAFYFAEKKQAVLLAQNIFFNQELEQLPDGLSERYHNYTKDINNLQLKALTQEGSFNNELFQLKTEKNRFLDSILTQSSELQLSLQQPESITLSEISQQLDDETAVLHYLWNDSGKEDQPHQVLFISKGRTALFQLEKPLQMESLLEKFNSAVVNPFSSTSDAQQFTTNSYELYKLLFPKELEGSLARIEKIIVVADQKLNALPFEALVIQTEPLMYLLEEKTISYAQSLSYLHNSQQTPLESEYDLLAMAPASFQLAGLADLPASTLETNTANEVFDGLVFNESGASKSAFMQYANSARIIHLATHASADAPPWISMQDSTLNLQDIARLKLNSELVILSACNTANGLMLKGEGVASLARGFFQSGARSVISSQWKTNDKATQQILASFYSYLDSGKSKAESLKKAKIDYLKNADLSETAPFYWSSLVLIGDAGNISSGFGWSFWWLLLLLIPLVLFFLKKPKKQG